MKSSLKRPYLTLVFAFLAVILLVIAITTRDEPGLNVPSEFPSIQAALDHAKPQEVVLVDARRGPYRETLSINTPQIEIRSVHGRAVIEGETATPQVVSIQVDDVTFSGFEVRGGGTGILAENVERITVKDNLVVENFGIGIMLYAINDSRVEGNTSLQNLHGIWLSHGANDNILTDNIVQLNMGIGLSLNNANRNQLSNGLSTENQTGINFSASEANVLSRYTVRKNLSGIVLDEASKDNAFERNLVEKNTQGVTLFNAHNNRFEQNRLLENHEEGVMAEVASQNQFHANTLKDNGIGIRFINASGNTVNGNTIETNRVGLHFLGSSRNNLIERNNIRDNQAFGLTNDTLDVVMALNNYWGDPIGARLDADAPGSGDLLVGAVMFDPWLLEWVNVVGEEE